MNHNVLTRITTPAAIAVAAVGVPADLYHFTIDSRAEEAHTLLFKAHGWMLTIAVGLMIVVLAGIVLRLASTNGDRLGPVATAVTSLTFAGSLLALGNITTEAFVMPQAGEAVADPAGYWLAIVIASFALFGFGWAITGLVAAKNGLIPWGVAALLAVGGVIGFAPLAGSYILLFVSIAITGLALGRRDHATA